MKHIISILVEDQFGAMARVVELFTSRGYNLDSVCTGESEKAGVHRMTLVTGGDDQKIKKILKLLKNIVYVLEVKLLEPAQTVSLELMVIKIKAGTGKRPQILTLMQAYKGNLIEMNHDFITFETTGSASKLDGVAEVFSDFEIVEMARTGEAAIHK
ncbi:MAG: acetolactate synthase small subunit [SAR324 cluster bacterium]|nr:acetolactate synthase small subunit [SAR324 cluster bacterium]